MEITASLDDMVIMEMSGLSGRGCLSIKKLVINVTEDWHISPNGVDLLLQLDLRSGHMSIIQAIIAVSMLVVCIAVAAGLMRLFDVKGATPEQTQADVERLLAQVNREVKVRRRVRAGAPIDAVSADFRRFSSFSETCRRIPSA